MTHMLYWLQQRKLYVPFPLDVLSSCLYILLMTPTSLIHSNQETWGLQGKFSCCAGNTATCLLLATAPQGEISRTFQGCAAAFGQTQNNQIKENNFAAAQYPELEEISQTHQMLFRHKRSSQIFKVGLHPMPRRVTKLVFQKVSAVPLAMLISQFAVDVGKQWFQYWRGHLQPFCGSQLPPLPPLFL